MNAKELYLMCVKENGLSAEKAGKLSRAQRMMLEEIGGKFFLKKSERAKFNVALTGGAFDVLHMGHVLTLQEARKLADVLVVVVATDETIEKRKGKKPIHPADYRAQMVGALRDVDLAIVGGADIMATFARVSPDIAAFGYDQKPFAIPDGCKSAHLTGVISDPSVAKTSRIIRELGI
jgi:cytidyltransferase-like protein